MRRPDTYSVSVGPAAYAYAKRVAEQTMRDNAKLGLTFEELAVALVLRGVALSAQAEPQPEAIPIAPVEVVRQALKELLESISECRMDQVTARFAKASVMARAVVDRYKDET